MHAYALEWAAMLLRWLHVIVAIAWIGASFYFVWLDNNLAKPLDPALQDKGVGGELWAVHGGGFYNPQKYLVAPKSLPDNLHWFYWESYSTWLSGFALFSVVYLFNAEAYLVDPKIMALSPGMAVAVSLIFLAAGWLAYDIICRLFGDRADGDRIVAVLVVGYVIGAVWLACHVFSARAAFLVSGAMLATVMSANVLFWIIPGQRKVVAAMRAGQAPDPIHGKRGKQRSVHNTYFTLPVVLAMLSNHFGLLANAPHNWLVLLLLMLAGVLIRRFFLLRHKGVYQWSLWAVAVAILLGIAIWLAPRPAAQAQAVPFPQVQQIIEARCLQCHAAKPSLIAAPGKNIVLETGEQISQHAQAIYQQVAVQKSMPLGNLTQMTEQERAVIAAWFMAGGGKR